MMKKKKFDNLGQRMKQYECVSKNILPRRLPVLIRIDGCHFHSYTKGCNKPFDDHLAQAFWETSKFLASKIMGCQLIYHQSDEISILLMNNQKLTTESWFDNNLQKIVSVSASLATAKFNEYMKGNDSNQELAFFDSRAWILPYDEVANYFIWRQNDATKNSKSMLAQSQFAHNELQGLSGSQLQDKLMAERNINWNDLPTWQKRGACIIRKEYIKENALRRKWDIDLEIPIFTQDRMYINRFVYSDIRK